MDIPVVGHLLAQLRNQARLVNADTKITKRLVWSLVDKHVRWLIKRESSKLRIMKMGYLFQTLKCVEVIEVPASDETCHVITKCKIWRTRLKIPEVYTDEDGIILKAVYSVDGSEEFTPIKLQEFMRKVENPHSKYDKSRYYYFNNGYLYFPNNPIKIVQIKGYFIDEVVNSCVPGDEEKRCKSHLDKKLRLPDYLLGELTEHVMNDLINIKKIPPDPTTNKQETH